MLKIAMSWPERNEEFELADRMLGTNAPETSLEGGEIEPVLAGQLDSLRSCVAAVIAQPELVQYAVDVVRATRSHENVLLGAGPRATQALVLASRARAALAARDFITPDDVRTMARPVLEHRLFFRWSAHRMFTLSSTARASRQSAVSSIVRSTRR